MAVKVVKLTWGVVGPPRGSNIERSGKRDLTLSCAVRMTRDLRQWDVDLAQPCKDCNQVEIVFEASANPNRATTYTRTLARQLGVPAMKVVHAGFDYDEANVCAPYDYERRSPVTFEVWSPPSYSDYIESYRKYTDEPWLVLYALLFWLHELHRRLACRRR